MEKIYNNQPHAQDEIKDVRGLGNNWSNKQIFWGNGKAWTGGGYKQEINRMNTDRRSENEEAWDKQHFANTWE